MGLTVVLVGLAVMAGWLVGNETLKTVLPGLASMKFNTASGFVLAGAALLCMQKSDDAAIFRAGLGLALILLTIAGLTIVEYGFDVDLGIDEAIVADPEAAGSLAGRMSLGTAVGFMAVAASLLALDTRSAAGGAHASELLSLLIILIGSVALLGYLFDVQALYRFGIFSSMALHTALLFVVTALAVLLARPCRGLVATLFSERMGSRLARMLLPAVVLGPVLLSWLFLAGAGAGHYTTQFGYALSTLSSIVILSTMVWYSAFRLNALHLSLEQHSRSSAQLAAIVSSSDDAIIGADLQGNITTWNAAAERLYGFEANEIVGQPITRIVPEDRLYEEAEIFESIRKKKHVEHLETIRLNKDGRPLELSINASPIKDETGNLIGVSKIAHDISRRKRGEELFQATVRASPTGIIVADADGSIVLANAAAEDIFGYSRDELVGKNVDLLVPDRLVAEHAQNRAKFRMKPEARRMGAGRDLFGLRKDGTEIPVEIGLSPVATAGRLLVLSSIVDITERKRSEEALRQRTEELGRSNRDLEQFAYVASHDLQEPLRAVSGCVQLLQKRYEGKLDERANEFISHAVSGAERMQKMIEDLLTYSRVGRVEDAFRETDVSEILGIALANLGATLRESNAEITHAPLPVLQAIPGALALLLQNLLSNAVKFRRKDVRAKVHIAAEHSGEEWLFSVEDNGIGIESQYLDRVFDIFQRLHTRREYPGTGIGLPLCKRIVEKHGGQMWIESKPGASTTVFFTLPEKKVSTVQKERPADERTTAD